MDRTDGTATRNEPHLAVQPNTGRVAGWGLAIEITRDWHGFDVACETVTELVRLGNRLLDVALALAQGLAQRV